MEIKEVYLETSGKFHGYSDQTQKKWMFDATWNNIKDGKEIKSEANVQVKRSVRRDKRQWVDELAQKTKEPVKRGDLKKLYNITKKLSRKLFNRNKPVRNKRRDINTGRDGRNTSQSC
jgi:hypothetical protein